MNIKIVNILDEITLDNRWVDATKFNSKNRLISIRSQPEINEMEWPLLKIQKTSV